jgi:NAD+ synthase (glutamine-hydrolysing)
VQVQRRYNAASVLCEGSVLETYAKRELPNYQVFDEYRYFTRGQGTLRVPGRRRERRPADLRRRLVRGAGAAGAGRRRALLVVPNASPFHVGKDGERVDRMASGPVAVGLPLVYAHLVGGQDEVIFDGASFASTPTARWRARAELRGRPVLRAGRAGPRRAPVRPMAPPERRGELWHALVLGVRDYIGKNGFPGVLLGCRAASTRRWCWRSRSTRWAPTRCGR